MGGGLFCPGVCSVFHGGLKGMLALSKQACLVLGLLELVAWLVWKVEAVSWLVCEGSGNVMHL